MVRSLGLLALLFVAAAPVRAAELTVTFITHAAVHVTDGETALLVDFPYDPGETFTPWVAEQVPEGPRPLCLITHGHRDHLAPERAGQFCALVLGPESAVGALDIPAVGTS